jgi:hypothetical protein
MSENEKKSGVLSQIIVAVVIALIAGGSSPWWWGKLFPPEGSAATDQPLSQNLEATRQFFIGRWQVERSMGMTKGATFMDYFENGSFSGEEEVFGADGIGRRVLTDGRWNFTKIAKDKFRLTLDFVNGNEWQGNFKIIDRDRIHNIDENYDAVRVSR